MTYDPKLQVYFDTEYDPSLQIYFDALKRLIDNEPINIQKGGKINNDTVALEAGRKRGSIKKSRDNFLPLIEAIKIAQDLENQSVSKCEEKLEKYKRLYKENREKYEQALNRELMLVEQLKKLEKELAKVKSYAVNNI